MLYSQYDKEWSVVEHGYGNVNEVNSFNRLTDNGAREKRLRYETFVQ